MAWSALSRLVPSPFGEERLGRLEGGLKGGLKGLEGGGLKGSLKGA